MRLVEQGMPLSVVYHAPPSGAGSWRWAVTRRRGTVVDSGRLPSARGVQTVVLSTRRWDCDALDLVLLDHDDGAIRCRRPLWVKPRGAGVQLFVRGHHHHPATLEVAWRHAPGNRWDWIGVLRAGQDPAIHTAPDWTHTHATVEGRGTLSTAGLAARHYDVVFCVHDGYECLARAPFVV